MQSRAEQWALDKPHRTQKGLTVKDSTFPTVEKRTENKEKETKNIKKIFKKFQYSHLQ